MRSSRFCIVLLFLVTLALGALALAAQVGRGGVPDAPTPLPPVPGREPRARDARLIRMQKEHLKTMNRERFERMKKDSEELLELATELRAEIEDGDENILSVKVVRNAESIEKLAKNIREKMSEYIGPGVQ